MTRKDLLKLERTVNARRKLVKKLVEFVCKVVCAYGEEKYRSERSCNTHTKWELNAVGGWVLKADFGQTSMGGNDVYIYYENNLVFHVYYQAYYNTGLQSGINDCEVRSYYREIAWLPAFKRLMSSFKSVLAKRENSRKKEVDKAAKNSHMEKQHQELLKEAKRLGLTAE